MLTKTNFLIEYEKRLRYAYAATWAKDETKMKNFMDAAKATLGIINNHPTVDHTQANFVFVWKQLGGKGKPTLKALRALPL